MLTGETTIVRSDVVYDCGKSMNPAVDIGQVGVSGHLGTAQVATIHIDECGMHDKAFRAGLSACKAAGAGEETNQYIHVVTTKYMYICVHARTPPQVEGAFIYGVGLFLTEEILTDSRGHQLSQGTWLYKPPTIDNIPRVFNVELLNSTAHRDRILSSKGNQPLHSFQQLFLAIDWLEPFMYVMTMDMHVCA